MELPSDLTQFLGGESRIAEAALRRLEPRLRRFLKNYLAKYVRSNEDIEDLTVLVLEKLWGRRCQIEVANEAAWWAYVAKTARNAAFDLLGRSDQRQTPLNLDSHEIEGIQTICRYADDTTPVLDAADELWLSADTALSLTERRRRLLAAQLHFLEGRPWAEIAKLVSPFRPVTRSELDGWLASKSTRLALSYRHLYRSNDEVCVLLIGSPDVVTVGQLDALARGLPARAATDRIGSWTRDEVRVILYRYRNGLNTDKIIQMRPDLSRSLVTTVEERCTQILPFPGAALQLRACFAADERDDASVRHGGLWRRLVLQYFVVDDLPQKLNLERTEPAAKAVDVTLNAGVLNSWLSNGRIFAQLLAHLKAKAT